MRPSIVVVLPGISGNIFSTDANNVGIDQREIFIRRDIRNLFSPSYDDDIRTRIFWFSDECIHGLSGFVLFP